MAWCSLTLASKSAQRSRKVGIVAACFRVRIAKKWRKCTHPERKLRSAQPLHLRHGVETRNHRGVVYLSLRSSAFSLFRTEQERDRSLPHAPNRRNGAAAGLSRLTGRTPEPDHQTDGPVTGSTRRRLRSLVRGGRRGSTGAWCSCQRRGLGSGHAHATTVTRTCSDSKKAFLLRHSE